MPLTGMDLLCGWMLPATLAGSILLSLRWFPPAGAIGRWASSLAFVGGFWLAYFSLGLGPWRPETHWHWLPWVMLIPLAIGPVSEAGDVSWPERVSLYFFAAVVASWLLVPSWPDLSPPRSTYLAMTTGAVLTTTVLVRQLQSFFPHALLCIVFAGTLLGTFVVLALSGSLRFAQMAGAGSGCLIGMAAVSPWSVQSRTLNGLSASLVMLLTGTLVVGQTNSFSNVPRASYCLLLIAPLSLWLSVRGPLAQPRGKATYLLQMMLPVLVVLAAVGLAAYAELGGASEAY